MKSFYVEKNEIMNYTITWPECELDSWYIITPTLKLLRARFEA